MDLKLPSFPAGFRRRFKAYECVFVEFICPKGPAMSSIRQGTSQIDAHSDYDIMWKLLITSRRR